ncbi:uncharacterized protein LOC135594241 [Musa acuminata AAA Group]|uniref:uncharacterized protein LOC135594241 n=1 Tax=Musa acuminata AAA Group TaxID=214697 RepID=UPI0031D9089D
MKPALLYVVILILLLRLQPQPVANGCCDAFCAVLCRGTDLSAAITSTTTVTTTTVTTTNRSTTTTTITTIEMPQRLIPNGSNDTPVYPAAAAGTPSVTKVFPLSLPANENGLPAPDPDARKCFHLHESTTTTMTMTRVASLGCRAYSACHREILAAASSVFVHSNEFPRYHQGIVAVATTG